jgi:hypothetical protein
MTRRASLFTLALSGSVALALAACGGGEGDPESPAECNPLGTTGCVLPWPSSVYQRADATSATGVRLDLPLGALPINVDDIEIDPTWINRRTGFSAMTQILVTFPGGVSDANLVFHDDFPASLTDASPTVIVDMMTNQRVAHFAEIDVNELDYADNQVLYLRPATRLVGGHRYAVAVRRTLKGRAGGELAISPAFQAVLDGRSSGHARLDAAAAGYPAVFQALETAGIPRTDLVVAFDFMTADDDSIIVDQLAARDAAMAVVGDAEGVTYQTTLDESPDSRDPMIARRVMFDYTTPQIADPLGTGFYRGGDGRVIAMGTTTAPASIIIPECATPTNKARIVIYGHGFFGSLEESMGGYVRRFAKDTCSVVIGGLWRGMSEEEVTDAILALNDANKLPGFTERMWQGMVDFMTLAKLAKGKLAREQLVDNPGNPGAQSIVDTSQVFYYGISQGHILGSTLFAFDPTMERGVMSVGGANWAVMFERSKNWTTYSVPLKGAYDEPRGFGELNSVILQQVIEMGFEIVDGGTVAPRLLNGGVPGTPPKQFLHQMSVGDCQVPNIASLFQARSIGLPLLTPSTHAPYGLIGMDGPLASAFVIMDEHPEPLPPESNQLFGYDNEAHENLRRRTATVEQIESFFDTGEITNFCTGACDCAAGNCGTLP